MEIKTFQVKYNACDDIFNVKKIIIKNKFIHDINVQVSTNIISKIAFT